MFHHSRSAKWRCERDVSSLALIQEALTHLRTTVVVDVLQRSRGSLLRLHVSRKKALEILWREALLRRRTLIQDAATALLEVQRTDIVLLHNPENHLLQRLHPLRLLTHLLLQRGRLLIQVTPRLDDCGQVLELLLVRQRRYFQRIFLCWLSLSSHATYY
jgi:hypothetical protein